MGGSMQDSYDFRVIAHIETDFKEKFGIPRQSGRTPGSYGRIVFTPEYRVPESLRGITEYSHLWLLFVFSESVRNRFSPTVRPPRLGGNRRVGVFATRSPFRPNPIGLSSVKLVAVQKNKQDGLVLIVEGADLLDGTPIIDIKPYLPYTDSHPDAVSGFAEAALDHRLSVSIEDACLNKLPKEKQPALLALLSDDPRPSYQRDEDRIYGLRFAEYEIRFRVSEDTLTVLSIE